MRTPRRARNLLLGLVLVVGGCGGPAAQDASPLGAWWRPLRNDAGPAPLQFFEVRADGTCLTYGPEYLQDRATCSIEPGAIRIRSMLNPAIGGDIPYSLEDSDRLVLELGPPLNQRQEWTRVSYAPFFELRSVGDLNIPGNIALLVRTLVGALRDWREDAVPERLELDTMKNGEMQATLDVYSPSDGAAQRLTITRYEIQARPYQTTAGRTAIFPVDFLDLPRVTQIARDSGQRGVLLQASIGLTTTNWQLRFADTQSGITLDSLTGEPVRDANAAQNIANYNQQWDQALTALRRRFAPPPKPPDYSSDWPLPLAPSETAPSTPTSEPGYGSGPQNAWGQGAMDAYDRYQRGEATGDDCYRYGGC